MTIPTTQGEEDLLKEARQLGVVRSLSILRLVGLVEKQEKHKLPLFEIENRLRLSLGDLYAAMAKENRG